MAIKPVSTGLSWLVHFLNLFQAKQIVIPSGHRDQTLLVDEILQNDVSGMTNAVLDFAINAGIVDFSVETSNKTLSNFLNDWLRNINKSLRGYVPVGVESLAKEYYRERWKSSSFLLLRTSWETVEGWKIPTKLWFVDGKDLAVQEDEERKILGDERYGLLLDKNKTIPLRNTENHKIFVQKPYESWGSNDPVPFLIRRGVYHNLKFLQILQDKGVNVAAKALEYLMMMKKGNADLVKNNMPEFIYNEDDLKKAKTDFEKLMGDMKANGGMPTYTTNFDTELEHLIPEYNKILHGDLYAPIERRILAGLGFIEVVEGVTQSRRDAVINPRVFVSEVQAGVRDFKNLLQDIVAVILEENRVTRKKLANTEMVQVRCSPVKSFYSDDSKEFLRSLYDRGLLSKRTMVELGVDIDFDSETERRDVETKEGLDEKMYPPVIQNQEEAGEENTDFDNITPDKLGPEAKNYTAAGKKKRKKKKTWNYSEDSTFIETVSVISSEENGHNHKVWAKVVRDGETGEVLDVYGHTSLDDSHQHTLSEWAITDEANGHTHTYSAELMDLGEIVFEEAPYKTNNQLPKQVQKLPSGAKTIWRKTFNSVYDESGDEEKAIKIAWSAVKSEFKKVEDKWVKKEKANEGEI